ncbi:hypothetical protein IAT38_006739 [Cryptococcus sp. DSM 104549]
MARNLLSLPRNLRVGTPAKLLLVLFALVFYFAFPFQSPHDVSVFTNAEAQAHIAQAPLSELVDIYEQLRLDLLHAKRFNSSATADKLRAPKHLPDGSENFDVSLVAYLDRLRHFVDDYCKGAPAHIHIGARNTLKNLIRRLPPKARNGAFPSKVWSTHPQGADGVEEGFELWAKLLPLPLPPALADQLSPSKDVDFLEPVRKGGKWDVTVLDDNGLDNQMSQWTGEKLSRGIAGEGKWASMWGKLQHGVLRADVYRYVSMLVEGGVYSDSDTMPISHPYVWGLHAPSILHPDIQALVHYMTLASNPKPTKDRLNPNPRPIDKRGPPYPGVAGRSPISSVDHPDPSSILNPDISMVVAIEWDSAIGRTWRMWKQWTWFRLSRSWPDSSFPRSLEMVQNLLVAKPFHPIMMDTVGTIAQQVESGEFTHLSPLDLTGPGPFTDAVFRYLLVQYGVTPQDLRALRGPVRVGDILVLQEEAWHAPSAAMQRTLAYVDGLGLRLGTNRHGKFNPWLYNLGWQDWKSGGVKVAYHGLTGILVQWKGKKKE